MASYTSASQHYADYRDMPMVVNEQMSKNERAIGSLKGALEDYKHSIDDDGIEPYEARQLLPNACAVNLLVTMNARSLINFFRSRLCRRNVEEHQVVAQMMYDVVYHWWPELAICCGPPCYMDGKCNQGFMSCGDPWLTEEEIDLKQEQLEEDARDIQEEMKK